MMTIKITETGCTETLSLIDPATGLDYIVDFVDGALDWDADAETYVCDQETYDWWSEVVADNQALNERIYQLVAEIGRDAVDAAIRSVGAVELADFAYLANCALDDISGQNV